MSVSRRAKFVRWVTGRYIKGLDVSKLPVATARRHFEKIARTFLIRARGVEVEKTQIAGVDVDWLRPEKARKDKVMLYLHGGAYVMGSPRTHRQLASHIARAAGVVAVLPDYRLAPEHPFPAGLDDAVAVCRGLLEAGFKPEDIIVAGDSAGGGLSVATLLALRHAGDPLPAAAVLLSPFLDVTGSGESMTTRADRDPWFDVGDLHVVARYYCPDESDWKNPLVSPVFANVAGLPPMLIQVGDDEILLSDATRLADKLEAEGIDVELEIWPHMWHVFQMFIGKMPESRAAVKKIGRYIDKCFS
ncbi:MAG: alpha/beta hydrolase [Gammaproteobacteria bacterium]|nr:alpha/beta hydrolase [Gammaproteobacteria bacterium]MDH5617126.1 alpha/beta hydrolase [Gammaproteobacteria bacterium]